MVVAVEFSERKRRGLCAVKPLPQSASCALT